MIKFECCHCSQPIEAPDEMIGMEVDCPGCARKVKVRAMVNSPVAPRPARQKFQMTEAEKIETQARSFTRVALICVVIGVLALLLGIYSCIGIDATGGGSCWVVMAAMFGVAFWFYLVAQIIHIRALQAKK